MNTNNSLLQAVKLLTPAIGQHPTAVWEAAKEGAQKAADVLPESLDQVKVLIRKHPVLATCAVLAIGGLLSARGLLSAKQV
jgi:hypothetical protein